MFTAPDEHMYIIQLHIMSIQPANKAAEHLIRERERERETDRQTDRQTESFKDTYPFLDYRKHRDDRIRLTTKFYFCDWRPIPGDRTLVKENMVSPVNGECPEAGREGRWTETKRDPCGHSAFHWTRTARVGVETGIVALCRVWEWRLSTVNDVGSILRLQHS